MKARTLCLTALCAVALLTTGCESGSGTGALAGGGIGALIGGAAGGWQGAAIGGAIGIASGYIIGNEADKAAERKRAKAGTPTPPEELRPFVGTRWQLTDLVSEEGYVYQRLVVDFRPNGKVITTKTDAGGTTTTAEERYRVVGDILIVYRTGYILNVNFTISGQTMVLKAEGLEKWKATFRRAA